MDLVERALVSAAVFATLIAEAVKIISNLMASRRVRTALIQSVSFVTWASPIDNSSTRLTCGHRLRPTIPTQMTSFIESMN
jgi:hypothetical protein